MFYIFVMIQSTFWLSSTVQIFMPKLNFIPLNLYKDIEYNLMIWPD